MANKKQPEPSQARPFAVALDGIRRMYGDGLMLPGSRVAAVQIPRIPTGVYRFDHDLAGGIPAGRISLVSGEKGSGKSTIATRAVANFQRLCSVCFAWKDECACPAGVNPGSPMTVWLDVEGTFEPAWAQCHGMSLADDVLTVARPEFAEQAIDILDAVLRSQEVGLVVLDSIAQLVPTKEIEASTLDWQQGLQARLVNKMMRKIVSAVVEGRRQGRMPTVILINQLRQSITGFGTVVPSVEPAGKGQLFGSSVVIRMRAKEYTHPSGNTEKPPVLVTNGYRVRYSKVSPPHVEGEYKMALTEHEAPDPPKRILRVGDVDNYKTWMRYARTTGYVRKLDRGGWCLGQYEFRTLEEITAAVLNDSALFAKSMRRVIELAYSVGGQTQKETDDGEDEEPGSG